MQKNQWGGDRKHYFAFFFLWGCFNCQWLRGGKMKQKVLFRASWNWTFCLLLWLKPQTVRGSISPSSLYGSGVDQGNEERRWDQDFLLLPKVFESFPSNLSGARWCNVVHEKYLQIFNQMEVGFVGVDATLGDKCGTGEDLQSSRKWSVHRIGPISLLLFLFGANQENY